MDARAHAHLDVFIRALQDADKHVRVEAVRALGRLGRDAAGAVGALGEALEDEDHAVREWAAVSLRKVAARK
jgi:HEAT repeat protein